MIRPVCIFAGYIVRYPMGGMTLYQLNLMKGFIDQGYEVVFVEHFGWPDSCYDPETNAMTGNPSYGLRELRRSLERIGVSQWCYVDDLENAHGLQRSGLRRLCREAALLFSCAATTWVEEFAEVSTRVYFDQDPGFTQFHIPPQPTPSSAGYASPYDFQFHYTVGSRIGSEDCAIPTMGFEWRPMRNPVALDLIPASNAPAGKRYTTVMSWTAYGEVEFNGVVYGQKDVELLKLVDLPSRAGPVFEIALGASEDAVSQLRAAGWRISEAKEATLTIDTYLSFIAASRGEFSVAKEAYVKTRSGWFSDRSAVYLASAKPVVVQETGFSENLPCGEGLFSFSDAEGVVEALEEIEKDYPKHCRAAREIAEEYFEARKVVGMMLRSCGF